MKNTDTVELVFGAIAMKSESLSPRRSTTNRRNTVEAAAEVRPVLERVPSLSRTCMPMEWMDPMSWRLPSGKALAEFALQAGFLAPLVMNGSASGTGHGKARAKGWSLGAKPVGSVSRVARATNQAVDRVVQNHVVSDHVVADETVPHQEDVREVVLPVRRLR